METTKLLLEGYLIFGIILTYTIAILIGILIGERNVERESENGKQVQSEKEIFINERKSKILEQRNKTQTNCRT